jgi:hypothetical protein
MYQFDGVCYESNNDLLNGFAFSAANISKEDPYNFSLTGPGEISWDSKQTPISMQFPSCTFIPPYNSDGLKPSTFGLTYTDAFDLGWMCILVLVTAYSILLIKRVF